MPKKFEFKNENGETLAGTLEEPTTGSPRGVALFAHCFSCGKNILAASRVSRGPVSYTHLTLPTILLV